MTPEQWQRIQEIFDVAVEMQEEQRANFLDEACAYDLILRHQVESLIYSSKEADDFIEAAILEAANDATEIQSETNAKIGAYRIEREIARGGMGAVYLAVRDDDEFQKQVAIKLVRGINNKELLRRFRSERQILANLDHPNIARLLDGGTTDNGTPYVVMEYVDGIPIDEYCDRQRLSTKERLQLFRKVCDAIKYAHQNLVVHRDIKPSNILVASDSTPKLLDFGIAKLLNAESSPQTVAITRTDMRLMTPEYASPEQARGETITTASDIYSLGVVLFELLTGHRPYQFKNYLPQEMERIICECEPKKPSTAITSDLQRTGKNKDGETQRVNAEMLSKRRASSDKLRKQLSGDLDNIVLMALRKEPERRYSSVEQFSDDIRRHLEGLPISARHDTFSYRANKFIKRHVVGVAVTTAVVLLIAALVGFYTWRLTQERNRAKAEATKAEQVAAFLTQLFEASDPGQTKGETVTAKELLDRGAAKIEKELAGQPDVQAKMMVVMGEAYRRLGFYDQSKLLFERSLETRRKLYGEENVDVAESLDSLGYLLFNQDKYEEGAKLLRQSLEMRRRLLGNQHLDVAASMTHLAIVFRNMGGNDDEAESLYRQALAIRRMNLGNDHPDVADTMNNLAVLLQDKGAYDESETLFRQVIELERKRYGDEHPDLSGTMNDLAMLLQEKGDYEAAEPLFRRVLFLDRKILGDEHPDTVVSMNNLGTLLQQLGKYDEAESLLRQAISVEIKIKGENHWSVAFYQARLAKVFQAKGDYENAEKIYRQSLSLYRKNFDEDNKYIAAAMFGLGTLFNDKGEPQNAEPLLRKSLKILKDTLSPGHHLLAEAEGELGECLTKLQKYDEAEPLLLNSYNSVNSKFGAKDKRTATATQRLIKLYESSGQPDKAAQYRALLQNPEA
jgi:serine/threonine-protein kinase